MSEPFILSDPFIGHNNADNVSAVHSAQYNDSNAAASKATHNVAATKDSQDLTSAPATGNMDSKGLSFHSELLDSVFLNEDVDNTPMFDELDFVLEGTKKEDWVSLFDADHEVDSNSNPVVKDEDLLLPLGLVENEEPASNPSNDVEDKQSSSIDFEFDQDLTSPNQLMTPQTSSTLSTPNLDNGPSKKRKMDHLGCVKYSKKNRNQPLEPIKSNSNDPILMKRAKNTEAARRSRARKMERMSQLEDRVEELLEFNGDLSNEVTRLRQLLDNNNISY